MSPWKRNSLTPTASARSSRIYSKEAELKRTKEKIRAKEAELISEDITTQDRVMLLADLKELSERSGELEAEIERLVADKARYEYELRDYEQTVAAYGY
jgi:phage-related minor tail protein